MSADNWARCPRCVARMQEQVDELKAEIDSSYGKVTAFAYDLACATLKTMEDKIADEWGEFRTFREDYEIYGAGEGMVTVSYSGGCEVCDLSLSFTEDHPLPVKQDD